MQEVVRIMLMWKVEMVNAEDGRIYTVYVGEINPCGAISVWEVGSNKCGRRVELLFPFQSCPRLSYFFPFPAYYCIWK